MKKITAILLPMLLSLCCLAQDHPHYTMFMYNKMLYNPAYAGSRNITSVNGIYRSQWVGLDGAPRTMNLSIDGAVGNYMKPFRPVALGLTINHEQVGVTENTAIMGYYAYRIPTGKSVLSFGLQGGFSLYNAHYTRLNAFQPEDRVLNNDVRSSFLPNVGGGVYWTGDRHYLGFSAPGLLQNYYDKSQKTFSGGDNARQVRTYFLSGGYAFPVSENISLLPQFIGRYAGNSRVGVPVNADFNLSCILYNRLMLGVTYRTDKSIEGIVHIQATKMINIGYAYDYTASGLNRYNSGTHELMVGFDIVRDMNRYVNPRFIRNF